MSDIAVKLVRRGQLHSTAVVALLVSGALLAGCVPPPPPPPQPQPMAMPAPPPPPPPSVPRVRG